MSNIRPGNYVMGTVRIPRSLRNEPLIGVENTDPRSALAFPVFDNAVLNCQEKCVDAICFSKEERYLQLMLDNRNFGKYKRDLFTRMLRFNTEPCKPPYFCGAFRALKPGKENKLLYAAGRLEIPVLPPIPEKLKFNVVSVQSKPGRKTGSTVSGLSDSFYHPPSDDQSATCFVLDLLASATPGIGRLVIGQIYPYSADHHTTTDLSSSAKTENDRHPSIITTKTTDRYAWTRRGIKKSSQELPFLSESGPLAVTALLSVNESRFGPLPGFVEQNVELAAEQKQKRVDLLPFTCLRSPKAVELRNSFIKDVILVRMGITSVRFPWSLTGENNEKNKWSEPLKGEFRFSPEDFDSMCLGLSELALANSLILHIKAGTQYRQLDWFSRKMTPLTPSTGLYQTKWRGSTWASFVIAVSRWLQVYENTLQLLLEEHELQCQAEQVTGELTSLRSTGIVSAQSISGLLALTNRLHLLTDQIRFITELCQLSSGRCGLFSIRGIELLIYLARKCDEYVSSPVELIVQFIFRQACQPFLVFLERLLVDGIYEDSGPEFNLFMSDKHLLRRDASFWAGAFYFGSSKTVSEYGMSSGFLGLLPRDFERSLLRCAKSIHLLKSIDPKHFVFKKRAHFPRLQFPANVTQVEKQRNALNAYLDELQQSAVEARATRAQRLARAVAKRQALLRQAAEVHAANIARIEAESQRLLAARQLRQEEEFHKLKVAAEEAAARRRAAIEAEKASDKALLEAIIRNESYREEVITQARSELEDHYAALMKEAESRRRLADDRIEKNRLISKILHESGAKVRELKAARSVPDVALAQIFDHISDGEAPLTNTLDTKKLPDMNQLSSAVSNESVALPDEHTHQDISRVLFNGLAIDSPEQSSVTPVVPIEDGLSTNSNCLVDPDVTDPMVVLRKKFQQRNAGVCTPHELAYELLYPDKAPFHPANDAPNSSPQVNGFLDPNKLKTVATPVGDDRVFRFRERNRYGHSSDSTVQQMLYGKGTGPACRPSEWEAERAFQDKIDAITVGQQPDADTFCREALLPVDPNTPNSHVQPYTKDFPDLDKLNRVNFLEYTLESKKPPVSPECSSRKASCGNTDIAPLRVLLDQVIVSPLSLHIRQVDTVLCSHFLYDLHLIDHLQCLRQICFLENGEFCQLLLDGLFKKVDASMSDQSDIYDPHFLHSLMHSTLSKISPTADTEDVEDPEQCLLIYHENNFRLPVRVPIDLICVDQNNQFGGGSNDKGRSQSSAVPQYAPSFDCLSVFYKAPWPVNIILTPQIVHRYNLVFRQLVRVKFAIWALNSSYYEIRHDQIWKIPQTSITRSSAEYRANLHLLTLRLHEMNQVIRGLEAYLSNETVKASWSKFVSRLTASATDSKRSFLYRQSVCPGKTTIDNIDDLYKAHEAYLDEISHGCLLDPLDREIHTVFTGLLSCVHWFHKALLAYRRQNVTHAATVRIHTHGQSLRCWNQLCAAHTSFRQHARFLRLRTGRWLSASGRFPARAGLAQLVLALGINDFYASPLSIPTVTRPSI
ncbi:unnamed protein product [Calicophoron daubneyi]